MPRQSVTFDMVASTADILNANGVVPEVKSIRNELGTGSYSTILKHLRIWRESQVRLSQTIEDTLNPSITRAISNQISERIQKSNAEATLRIAQLQDELELVILEIERQTKEIEEKDQQLLAQQGEHATLLGRLHEKVAENEIIAVDLINERRANNLLRVEFAKADLRLEAVPKYESKIDTLQQEWTQERDRSSRLHEAAAVAEAKLDAKTIQCNELENKLSATVHERDEAANRAAVAITSLDSERSAKLANQKHLQDAVRNLNMANETARKAKEEVAELRGQLTVLNILKSTAHVTS